MGQGPKAAGPHLVPGWVKSFGWDTWPGTGPSQEPGFLDICLEPGFVGTNWKLGTKGASQVCGRQPALACAGSLDHGSLQETWYPRSHSAPV